MCTFILASYTYICCLRRVVGSADPKHITYILYEYQQLVDSSNIDSDIMLQIALDVKVCIPLYTLYALYYIGYCILLCTIIYYVVLYAICCYML